MRKLNRQLERVMFRVLKALRWQMTVRTCQGDETSRGSHQVDLYQHLASLASKSPAEEVLDELSHGQPMSRGETETRVVETGDEGRCGMLLGQIAP